MCIATSYRSADISAASAAREQVIREPGASTHAPYVLVACSYISIIVTEAEG
jgi:hypothetical protein